MPHWSKMCDVKTLIRDQVVKNSFTGANFPSIHTNCCCILWYWFSACIAHCMRYTHLTFSKEELSHNVLSVVWEFVIPMEPFLRVVQNSISIEVRYTNTSFFLHRFISSSTCVHIQWDEQEKTHIHSCMIIQYVIEIPPNAIDIFRQNWHTRWFWRDAFMENRIPLMTLQALISNSFL